MGTRYTILLVNNPYPEGLSEMQIVALQMFLLAFTESVGEVYIGLEGEDTFTSMLEQVKEENYDVDGAEFYLFDAETLELKHQFDYNEDTKRYYNFTIGG